MEWWRKKDREILCMNIEWKWEKVQSALTFQGVWHKVSHGVAWGYWKMIHIRFALLSTIYISINFQNKVSKSSIFSHLNWETNHKLTLVTLLIESQNGILCYHSLGCLNHPTKTPPKAIDILPNPKIIELGERKERALIPHISQTLNSNLYAQLLIHNFPSIR